MTRRKVGKRKKEKRGGWEGNRERDLLAGTTLQCRQRPKIYVVDLELICFIPVVSSVKKQSE